MCQRILGHHLTDQLDRLTAAVANRYTIQRELGAGGMATLYFAEDLKHHPTEATSFIYAEFLRGVEGKDGQPTDGHRRALPPRFLVSPHPASRIPHPLPLHPVEQRGHVDRQGILEPFGLPFELPVN